MGGEETFQKWVDQNKDSHYLVLYASEAAPAFTMKTKGSHPFFQTGSMLKINFLERLVRKNNNSCETKSKKIKKMRGSPP